MRNFEELFDETVTASSTTVPETGQTVPESAQTVPKTAEMDTGSTGSAPGDTEPAANDSTTAPIITDSGTNTTDSEASTTDNTDPTVPNVIAGTPQSTSLKPRYQGDAEFSQMVSDDWIAVIQADPRSYEALLYRPSNGTYGVVDEETGLESAPFTDLDNNQRELTYEDPVIVTLRDSNDSREAFEALDGDTNQDGLVDDFLIVSIAAKDIPKGSILEWNEEALDGSERRAWWYVNQLYSYGTQHVGTLYYCIPARTFDTTDSGTPV